jgi:hypothetical protein
VYHVSVSEVSFVVIGVMELDGIGIQVVERRRQAWYRLYQCLRLFVDGGSEPLCWCVGGFFRW